MDVKGGGGAPEVAPGTRLADLGEFGLIDRVLLALTETGVLPDPAHGVLVGPGDDAAVVSAPDGRVVVSTDVLVEGRHFRRDWSSGYDVGVRAAAANLADIAAMGAHPTALTIGLAAPADLPVAWILELARGLAAEATAAGTVVVGGDMVRSDTLVISVTALGRLDGRPAVLRSGARPGDVVVLCGRLGWAAAGLRLLTEGITDGPLVEAHRRPSPPYGWGPRLAALGATAMLDVSDGLLQDAGHLAAASGVAIDLRLDALRTLGGPGITDVDLLSGGDDHPLLATLPESALLDLHADGAPVVVGLAHEGGGVTVDGNRQTGPGGHDHFPAA
jgi:thiamine-monophosphate kinase